MYYHFKFHLGLKAGIDIDAFAPRLSYFWGIGMNFFMVGCGQNFSFLNLLLGNSQDESWASAMGSPDEREIWGQKSKVMATEGSLPNLRVVTNRAGMAIAFTKKMKNIW